MATSKESVDCGIILALEEEFSAFTEVFRMSAPIPRDTETYYSFYFTDSTGQRRSGVATFIGRVGPEAATLKTDRLIASFTPTLVVNIGISGALSNDVRLGDVVFATDVDNYSDRGKVVPGKDLPTSLAWGGSSLPGDPELANRLRNLPHERSTEFARWIDGSLRHLATLVSVDVQRELRDTDLLYDYPRLHAGPIASGPFVSASPVFRSAILDRNRNFLALDMESSGVMLAINERIHRPQRLVIRGISDFGDERKKRLDLISGGALRSWALRNAAELLHMAMGTMIDFSRPHISVPISSRDAADPKEELHRTILAKHLPKYLAESEDPDSLASLYSGLFSLICRSAWRPSAPELLIQDLALLVKTTRSRSALRVDGLPGTGKSTLLGVLYLYLHSQFIKDPEWPLPVYLNLPSYEAESFGDIRAARAALARDLAPLLRLLKDTPATNVAFMVDGIEEFSSFERAIEADVLEFMNDNVPNRRIIGVALSANRSDEYFFRKTTHLGSPNTTLTLHSIDSDSPAATDFLISFSRVSDSGVGDVQVVESLRTMIDQLNVSEVDLFVCGLILSRNRSDLHHEGEDFSSLLARHCEDYLRDESWEGRQAYTLSDAAFMAYRYAINKERLAPSEINGDPRWRLIHQHSTVREFFLGYYIIEQVKAVGRGESKEYNQLAHVFTHRINRAGKEIMNFTIGSQQLVLAGLRKVYEHGTDQCKPHACYLAGRIENEELRGESRSFLLSCKDSFLRAHKGRLDKLSDQDGLLIRTIYISLVELGDLGASNEYLSLLMRYSSWDEVNRGFHLEYYGDIPYSPHLNMSHRDRLGDFSRTYEYLTRKILRKSANGDLEYPLLDIEAYTVLSLAQHRHAKGRLRPEIRTALATLAQLLVDKRIIRSRSCSVFCKMMIRHLREESFTPGNIAEELYRLKTTPRSGWVKRGIPYAESVADHTQGAHILALLYLPAEYKGDKRYSKRKIIDMLLIHELAEAYTGDLLPEQKGELARQEEAEQFDYLALTSTYSGVDRMMVTAAELWREFQAGSGINAQVAKELDKLENLLQLYIYRKAGYEIDDFHDWERSLIDAVTSDVGKNVREIIRAAFPFIAGQLPRTSSSASLKPRGKRPRRRRGAGGASRGEG